ncbi:MAG: flagellar biosynthetic protein FliR, partial [Pseudomonadota bacterium]
FMLQLVFNAVVIAGESIATTMGLGYALLNDPSNGIQVPIVSQFYTIFVTLLFLAFNGHHELIQLLSASFEILPVDTTITSNMLWHVVEWSVVLFSGALQVALPALAALLTVNLVLGIMTRVAPQLNIFSVGFPIAIMVGFVVILLTLPSVASIFQSLTALGFESIRVFLEVR